MWTTQIEIPRSRWFETLHECMRTARTDMHIRVGEFGDIHLTWRSSAANAALATSEALQQLHALELEIERQLSPSRIATTAATISANVPQLVGLSESARILEISKSRVSQLSKGPAFPAPVAVLAMGPVFLKSAVEHYARRRRSRSVVPR